MDKKVITSILFLLSFNISLLSQYTFQRVIADPDDQVVNSIVEDDEGNLIMAGRKKSTEFNISQAYLLRLDPSGDLLDEIVLDTSLSSTMIFDLHFFNDSLFLLGYKQIDFPSECKLWYLKLDKNLVKADEKFLGMPANSWFSYLKSIIDSDSNFVMTGYTTRDYPTINNDVFFYKLSVTGDSIISNFITTEYQSSLSFDLIEKNDQTGYYSYGFKYSTLITHGGQRYDLSKQFDSINVVSVPYWIDLYMSSEWLNDSLIIITGNGEPPEVPSYSLSVLTTAEDNTPIDYNHFKMEDPMRDHTAMYRGVSLKDDNIYIGGTSNFNYANPFFSTSDSWFHLIKVNPDLSPTWEYWYGGDAYYFLYSILATSDGGCLMVGNRYDYEIQEQERDIYVVKVNNEGLIVWTQEIQTDKSLFTIYPNPGENQVNINLPYGEFDFELFSLNGQALVRQQVNCEMNTINTGHLKPGIYFYRILDHRSQLLSSGKWIKN